jgi:quinol-cytochrome oxidoreductase complex cytochrome b subunit
MLSLRERAFRNVIFVIALVLFLVLAVCFTYALGKMLLSMLGAFLLVIAIFLLVVTIDTWRKAKEE